MIISTDQYFYGNETFSGQGSLMGKKDTEKKVKWISVNGKYSRCMNFERHKT